MTVSHFTQITLQTTLTDLLEVREKALSLHLQARRLNEMAKELLDQHGNYLMPRGGQFVECEKITTCELDASMWRRAFDLTGFRQLMDAEAVAHFERSLSPAPPEFTAANVRSTFIDLHQRAGEMFRRGVVNVFRSLSDDYRTNAKEPFRIGNKVVMTWMIQPGWTGGLQVRHGTGQDKLNDIDRVIKTLDGKAFQARSFESALNGAFKAGHKSFEDDYYKAKAFKNGNLHLEFLRPDLLDKLNEQIAEHYAEGALGHAA
jgi:hypothetical protein